MSLELFNTASRKIEEFIPVDGETVKVYTCGPTVYNFQHIGNYTAYVYWDVLVRVLKLNGYTVRRVLNLTDVGHLASDADDGEDKLERSAKKEGRTVWEVAEFYARDFLQNFQRLNLVWPEKIAKATDYIAENIELIEKLDKKGFVYEIDDGIYYDTSKFVRYADFAQLDLQKLQAGARVEFNASKRNVADFALWKFIQPGEDHAMQWEYRGRMGYPGWHIECASIIHKELGEPIDIHTGGIDHIPVHHSNEIAESEAAHEVEMARYWLHCNFVMVEGEKMSKSLGNVLTLADLARQGFTALDFKTWVMMGHFQTLRNFRISELEAARNRRLHWRNRIARLYQSGDVPGGDFIARFRATLNNNLATPAGLALIDKTPELGFAEWREIDEALGLDLIGSAPDLSEGLKELLTERAMARKAKDFVRSDELRAKLEEVGVGILDEAEGQIWQYLV